jgi:hypothetical protein
MTCYACIKVPNDSLYTVQLYPLIVVNQHLLSAVNILGSDTVLSPLDAVLSAHTDGVEEVDSLLPGPSLEPDGRDIDKARSSSWLETSHLIHGRELGVV